MRHDPEQAAKADRKALMALLSRAPAEAVEQAWRDLDAVEAELVRGPETGLVTVRGRMGGGGAPFNLGEATVTRATVKLPTGEIGHAYGLGRDGGKARQAATIDALWQRPGMSAAIAETVMKPLEAALAEADRHRREETAATKVDFFTMVRGED